MKKSPEKLTRYVALLRGVNVGGKTLKMETLKKEFKIDLRVRGVLNSKTMVLSEQGRTLENWRESVKESGLPCGVWKTPPDILKPAAFRIEMALAGLYVTCFANFSFSQLENVGVTMPVWFAGGW